MLTSQIVVIIYSGHSALRRTGVTQGLHRMYTIEVAKKAEDCFYLDIKKNRRLNIHFVVGN